MSAARHAHIPGPGRHPDAAAVASSCLHNSGNSSTQGMAYPCSPPQDPLGYPCSPPHVVPFVRADQRDSSARASSSSSSVGQLSAVPGCPAAAAAGPREAAYPCSPGAQQPILGTFVCSDLRDAGIARSPPGAPARRAVCSDATSYPHSPGASYPQSNSQPSSEDGRESPDFSSQGSSCTAVPLERAGQKGSSPRCSVPSSEFVQEPRERQHNLQLGQFQMPSDVVDVSGSMVRPPELSLLGRVVTRVPWEEATHEPSPEPRKAPTPAYSAPTPLAHQPAQAIMECSFWHVRQGEQALLPPAGSGSSPSCRGAACAAPHAAAPAERKLPRAPAPEDEELPPWPHEMT